MKQNCFNFLNGEIIQVNISKEHAYTQNMDSS